MYTTQNNLILTNHAVTKSNKRFISEIDIEVIIEYGSVIHKQNSKFHFIRSNKIPGGMELNTRLSSIVVITAFDDAVITCYYNDRPKKHISKKNKRYSHTKKRNRSAKGLSTDELSLLRY